MHMSLLWPAWVQHLTKVQTAHVERAILRAAWTKCNKSRSIVVVQMILALVDDATPEAMRPVKGIRDLRRVLAKSTALMETFQNLVRQCANQGPTATGASIIAKLIRNFKWCGWTIQGSCRDWRG